MRLESAELWYCYSFFCSCTNSSSFSGSMLSPTSTVQWRCQPPDQIFHLYCSYQSCFSVRYKVLKVFGVQMSLLSSVWCSWMLLHLCIFWSEHMKVSLSWCLPPVSLVCLPDMGSASAGLSVQLHAWQRVIWNKSIYSICHSQQCLKSVAQKTLLQYPLFQKFPLWAGQHRRVKSTPHLIYTTTLQQLSQVSVSVSYSSRWMYIWKAKACSDYHSSILCGICWTN